MTANCAADYFDIWSSTVYVSVLKFVVIVPAIYVKIYVLFSLMLNSVDWLMRYGYRASSGQNEFFLPKW